MPSHILPHQSSSRAIATEKLTSPPQPWTVHFLNAELVTHGYYISWFLEEFYTTCRFVHRVAVWSCSNCGYVLLKEIIAVQNGLSGVELATAGN